MIFQSPQRIRLAQGKRIEGKIPKTYPFFNKNLMNIKPE